MTELEAIRARAAALGGPPDWPGATPLGATADGCAVVGVDGIRRIDLTAGRGHLLGFADPEITAAVTAAVQSGLPATAALPLALEVAEALCARFPAAERAVPCASRTDALACAVQRARAVTGRDQIVCCDADDGTVFGPVLRCGWHELEAVLDGNADSLAAVVLDLATCDGNRGALTALATRLATAGIALVCDETDSAFRLAAAGRQTALGLAPDLTVLGASLGHGTPFGVVLGRAAYLDALGLQSSAAAPALAAARTALARLREQPVHERLEAIGERLRDAFAAACAAHDIRAELRGPGARLQLHFDGQENADPALLWHAFHGELFAAGLHADRVLQPCAAMTDDDVTQTERALAHAVGRLRTLLIEHNSYLSGGLPFVFPDCDPTFGARGIAVYRFPARAPVDVEPVGAGMRIAIAAGDLGEVTSSGFYVPTRVRGDFTATLHYELIHWQPGPQSVCLALFAQDEPSLLRYYAQRRTAGDDPHEVLGNFNNAVLTETRRVDGDRGAFRIERHGDRVTTWHGVDGEWVQLGEHRGDPTSDVLFGAKIWSSGTTGGFEARLSDLTVEGELPADQIAPVPVRPDPRG